MRLSGHTKEGYGLSWSTIKNNLLVSGSDDAIVCVYDINNNNPILQHNFHNSVVEDVCCHRHSPDIIASIGDDRKIIIYDIRSDKIVHDILAHDG